MTCKQRVEVALNHKTPDKTPYNIELTSQALERFCQYSGILPEEYFDFAGNHIEKCGYNGGEYINPGIFRDEFGVVWDRTGADKDIGYVSEYLLAQPNFDCYEFPKPDLDSVHCNTQKLLENQRDTYKLGKIGMLLFERAWSLRGMENLMCDFLVEEAFVQELFGKITEYNLEIINEALKFDIDGFYFGDDYGMQTGLIFSPEIFRKYIKPCLKTLFEPIKSKGKKVMLHSCGNIGQILPDLIGIGLDVYQTVQPEIYDLKSLKKEFGGDIAFWGGISTQQALPYLSPDEVRALVAETVGILGTDGGYICGPTHQVPPDIPPENIEAMIEVLNA